MQYLVQMRLTSSSRPTTPADGVVFIEQFILPTLDLCKKLQEEKKILAGGPMSGAVALVLILNAESSWELDDLITSLPAWPRMETEVTPLTSFEGRGETLRPQLERLRAQVQKAVGGATA
jgi:muconolactone delta-isomerase